MFTGKGVVDLKPHALELILHRAHIKQGSAFVVDCILRDPLRGDVLNVAAIRLAGDFRFGSFLVVSHPDDKLVAVVHGQDKSLLTRERAHAEYSPVACAYILIQCVLNLLFRQFSRKDGFAVQGTLQFRKTCVLIRFYNSQLIFIG